ncbi:MAG: hypothetical protein OMM_02216 [Candidatus Magnetoglobus multicellularis str. Araruama]|uniref:Uncharacterized protein n=1 Tax=Candidatus Magnetoglobus multicellularis str. Araruama TaxID=890399 RepID=A0A1V1PA36_9BACT|nr:MAG: hypothetical protein OMM_02216 [Candidatus Magnetoglobus multicellularis str. Araruama]
MARVEIPANGITESATISIEQLENTIDSNAAMGIKYIYAVHATHVESGRSLNYDQINQIAITLSFDLSLIRPGDLENSQYHVYRADTLEKMNSHQTERISNIRQSDYLGDGKMGSVTVWVDRLSFFAIGKPPDIAVQQFEESQLIDEGGGDCFIGVLR